MAMFNSYVTIYQRVVAEMTHDTIFDVDQRGNPVLRLRGLKYSYVDV
jgi:hypothetical protein